MVGVVPVAQVVGRLPGSFGAVVRAGLSDDDDEDDDDDDDHDHDNDDDGDEGDFQFSSFLGFSFCFCLSFSFCLSAALTILHCRLYLQKHDTSD